MHVVDASDPEWTRKMAVVEEVLETLGADRAPRLLALNKADLLTEEQKCAVKNVVHEHVLVSAVKKEGIAKLKEEISRLLSPVRQEGEGKTQEE